MMPLSRAIRRGGSPDPLNSALASLRVSTTAASPESACALNLHYLYTAWPEIGESVHLHPRPLSAKAEELGIIKVRGRGDSYRRETHCSVYHLITTLHDKHKWPASQIADLLEQARL